MIDIKNLIKSRYAQDSDFKKIFDMPDSISKRILKNLVVNLKNQKFQKKF